MRWRLILVGCAASLLGAGCGGNEADTGSGADLPPAGGSGSLTYALPEVPGGLDPLAASSRAQQTVTRQVHEPLVSRLTGPYGDTGKEPGLALSVRPSDGRTVWTLALRPGVRFQDGTPFNGAAVLANARRWRTSSAGQRLLPDLFAVDAPRPDQVRFLLERPVADLRSRLASPRLGIVSPRALDPPSGEGARIRPGAAGSGTGPFQAAGDANGRQELDRFGSWWGSSLGLGPALDAVVFLGAPGERQRLSLLEAGTVQVADPLGAAALSALAADPLLRQVGGPVRGIGIAGSVRGLDSARAVPVLSRVWLTDIAG
jgi:peptide/nickel transport system substrate-binding protein